MHNPSNGTSNLYFFNNIRSFIVILVVLLHVSLAYCSFTKNWWIVVSNESSIIADILCGSLDLFLMPILFFVSGYFTTASYTKCSKKDFIIKKIKCLYIPWLVGIIIFNPFLVAMIDISREVHVDSFIDLSISYYINFIHMPASVIQNRNLSPSFFSHYHLWYLSLLFYFFLVFVILSTCVRFFRKPETAESHITRKILYTQLLLLIFISSAGYATMFFIFGESWFVVSIIQLQLSRIIPYICFFIFGILSYKNKWVLNRDFIKHPAILFSAVLLLTPAYLYLSRILLNDASFLSIVIYGFSRYILCVFFLAGLIGVFRNYLHKETSLNRILNRTSFGLYFLHLNVIVFFLYIFNRSGSGDKLSHIIPNGISHFGGPLFQIATIFVLSLLTSTGLYLFYSMSKRYVKIIHASRKKRA